MNATQSKKTPFPYFKFYSSDWLEATRDLSPEERGLYIDFIALTMKSEGSLDDRDDWFAHQMHVSKRLWKSIKTKLVSKGKLLLSDGKIVNERCLKELAVLMDERKKRSSAATSREAEKRTSIPTQAQFSADSALVQPRLSAESDANQIRFNSENQEKPNKFNEDDITAVVRPCHYSDSDINKDKKEERERATLFALDEPEPGGPPIDCKVYVNGAAVVAPGRFTIPFAAIDPMAKLANIPVEDARDLVAGHIQALFANGETPRDPIAVAGAAIREVRRKPPKSARPEYTNDFEWFWERYPRKDKKGDAFDAWRALSLVQKRKAAQALKDQIAILRGKLNQNGKNVCPYPATWIRAGCWDDSPQEDIKPEQPKAQPFVDFRAQKKSAELVALLQRPDFSN